METKKKTVPLLAEACTIQMKGFKLIIAGFQPVTDILHVSHENKFLKSQYFLQNGRKRFHSRGTVSLSTAQLPSK